MFAPQPPKIPTGPIMDLVKSLTDALFGDDKKDSKEKESKDKKDSKDKK